MASSASFSILIFGFLLALKCEFSSTLAAPEQDSRLSVASFLYQIIGDVYELQNENKMMKEKIEMLEEKLENEMLTEKIEMLEDKLESGLESLESELETFAKGKI